MNALEHTRRPSHRLVLWILLIIVALGALSAFFYWRGKAPTGPRLLNEATKAREVRPFSEKPDERFAPLPIEPEKHGK